MAKPSTQIKCDEKLLTSNLRQQKADFLLSTATYGHKQVAAGCWHLLLAALGEQRLIKILAGPREAVPWHHKVELPLIPWLCYIGLLSLGFKAGHRAKP